MRRGLGVVVVTPARRGSHAGNRTTALRWARILRELGQRVTVTGRWTGEPCDVLVALHARESFDSIEAFRRERPDRPLVVALTGTDLYGDLHRSRRARRSVEIADRLVLLQSLGRAELPARARRKARIIYQSVPRSGPRALPAAGPFDVCVLAHLRAVKDPFRAALASSLLPERSRVRILQVGGAMGADMEKKARREQSRNPRYRWLGELPRSRALRVLGRSRLMVISSRMEGGANAVSEALACGVPVLASRIPGNVGLLGRTYPGYFEVGDTRGLALLLLRAETERRFFAALASHCRSRARLVDPGRELRAWRALLRELRRK